MDQNQDPNEQTPSTTAEGGDAGAATQQVEQPSSTAGTGDASGTTQEPPAPVVVPDGYVKAEEVETERTARTAAEQARLDAETARTAAEERATSAEKRARSVEIRAAAQALNFNDASDAEMYVGPDVEDVSAALAEVLTSKPYLAKQEAAPVVVTPTSPTNPARGAATLTLDSIKTMTAAQLHAQWPAVMAAMKANQ